MKTPGFSLTAALLLACLPTAGPTLAQGQPTAAQRQSTTGQGLNATFAYTRKKVFFDCAGRKKPIEATLTLPRRSERSRAIVFVTGAWNASKVGLGEEDELRSLADYLGEHGIAVLQLPEPMGGRSIGDLSSAAGDTYEPDIRAGLNFLKRQPGIDPQQIGLFGENENGAIATVTSTLTKDVSFVILAGTPIIEHRLSVQPSDQVNTYDLRPFLERVTCPVLVMQGDQDTSIPLQANLASYRNVLLAAKNQDTAFVALPGLNRALETTTGPNGRAESDMAPIAMRTLVRWLNRDTEGKDIPFSADLHGDEEEKTPHRKPSNPYGDVPGGVVGQFRFRQEMLWIPPIGGQQRPYGYWYW